MLTILIILAPSVLILAAVWGILAAGKQSEKHGGEL